MLDRNDNSINKEYLNIVSSYKNLSVEQKLSIKPLWTINQKIVMFGIDTFHLDKIQTSEALKILQNTSDLNTLDLFKNEPKNIRRIVNILRAWKQNITLIPPQILDNSTPKILDGHHRILASHFVQAKEIYIFKK
jgi:hypothetical protein